MHIVIKMNHTKGRYEIWEVDKCEETMVTVYNGTDATFKQAVFEEAVKMSRSYGFVTVMFSEG